MIRIALAAMLWSQDPPPPPSVVDQLKRELGLDDIQVHGYVRPRFNVYDDLITLGRDTTAPAFDGRDDRGLYFFDLRAWLGLDLLSRPWGLGIRLDIAGNDFNDGGILGNDTDVTNSNLGLGPAGLRDFDVDLGELRLFYEDGGWRAEVGRLPNGWGHKIVSSIHRDSVRVSKKVEAWTFTANYVTAGQSARASDVDEGVTGDDSAVKHTTGSIGEFDAVGASVRHEPSKECRTQLNFAKQIDSTRDGRFPEKLFVDLAGFYESDPWESSFEAVYLTGKGSRSAVVGERPDYNAYMGFTSIRCRIGETGLKAGLAAGIGSGDSTPFSDENNGFESLFTDETGYAYTCIYADDLHGYNGSSVSVRRGSGFSNTWFLQPNLRWLASEGVLVGASYTFLRAVREQPEGSGPLGPSIAPPPGRGNYGLDPAMRVDPAGADKTREIGSEVDLFAEFRVSKHVRIPVNLGLFFPGDIFGDDARTAVKFDLAWEFKF